MHINNVAPITMYVATGVVLLPIQYNTSDTGST